MKKKVETDILRAFQRIADLYIVSSLRDGMNLVAKEDVAADVDKNGAILLSEFTGASLELKEAISINPYDLEGFADSIKYGIELSDQEKMERMESLRDTVKNHDIYDWISHLLKEAFESFDRK
ncbi:MAG: trehalose-6-phosphate synthase [Candidatus Aenigmatarchaeota archaeon]